MRAPRHQPRAGDEGFAMPVAIMLGLIAVALMLAAGTYSLGRIDDHDRRRDRVVAMPVVDTAVTRIKFGLEQNLLAEHRDYVPTTAQLQQLVNGTEASIVPGSILNPPIPAGMPNVTVLEPMGPHHAGYWHLLRVFAPAYGANDDQGVVVAYVRAWTAPRATPQLGSKPRMVRIELRPGRFADYQAVIDGPIVFGQGATLNGPIHSNGFNDERTNFLSLLSNATERVSTVDGASVSCTGAAQITTASGSVDSASFPGCPVETNTGRFVNLLAAEEAFTRIRKACAETVPNVRCFDETYEGSNVPASLSQHSPDLRGYRVHLSPDSVTVSGYEIDYVSETPQPYPVAGAGTISTPPKSTTVLFFADNVIVSGTTGARVTIAARKAGEWSVNTASGSANIYVAGDTTYDGDGAVLGLLSQGGVILDAIKDGSGTHACISNLRAGVVAMAGTLTIDPRYTTRLYQQGAPSCGPIRIRGSLAAHRSPVLYWKWDNVAGHAGYSTRDYQWTDSLRRNPPPYFPTTDTWEARHVRPANLDCFSGGTITDQNC
jgi:hypothetical protein